VWGVGGFASYAVAPVEAVHRIPGVLSFDQACNLLGRFGARSLMVGWAATPFVAKGRGPRGAPNANVLPTNLIMMKGSTSLAARR